jgi:hypothetical protein
MKLFVRRFVVIPLAVFVLFAASAQAADDQPANPHVRILESCRPSLVTQATRLSPTVHELVDQLERSDLVVYVRCTAFKDSSITGRLSFLGSVSDRRYVVIELKLHEQYSSQIAILAHELQHAVEVASAPQVRSSETMAEHYRKIGIAVDDHPMIFETAAAREVGERVHRELFGVSMNTRAGEASSGSK